MGTLISQPSAPLTHPNSDQLYKDFLQNLIAENKIVVFSKTSCTFCTKAKSLLDELKLSYKAIELDVDKQCPNENCQKLVQTLIVQTRMRTVPQIFLNGKCIGGFNELEELSKGGKDSLKRFLEKK